MIFLGENIKFLRKKAGLTQGQLADNIGVKPNTISNYENGSSSPDLVQLEKIIKKFDVDAQKLLYEDLQTKSAENATEPNGGKEGGEKGGKRKVQKMPQFESPDESLSNTSDEHSEAKKIILVSSKDIQSEEDFVRVFSDNFAEGVLQMIQAGQLYPAKVVDSLKENEKKLNERINELERMIGRLEGKELR